VNVGLNVFVGLGTGLGVVGCGVQDESRLARTMIITPKAKIY